MIESFAFEGFRGSRGDVRGLRSLNVLIGPNNSGKSTALEALSLLVSAPSALEGVLRRRSSWLGQSRLDDVLSREGVAIRAPAGGDAQSYVEITSGPLDNRLARLYPSEIGTMRGYTYQSPNEQALLGIDASGRVRAFVLHGGTRDAEVGIYGVNPTIPDPSELLGAVDALGWSAHSRLLEFVRTIDPTLREIHAVLRDGEWHVHAQYADRSVPIAFAGEGMKTLFAVACAAAIEDETVLLEEPECFLHGAALKSMADLLWDAADAGKQIVLTTHSHTLLELLQERRDESESRAGRLSVLEFSRSDAGVVTATASAGGPAVLLRLQGE